MLKGITLKRLDIFKIFFTFSVLFILLSTLLYRFQLIGLTDHGFWLSSFYNLANNHIANTTLLNKSHFLAYPFIYIFTPFAYIIKNPIYFAYLLSYVTYLSWFTVSFLLLKKEVSVKNISMYFLLFFSSATILFYYNLNYNGYESVFLSIPFLLLSYYFAFIKQDYKKSILLFMPLLLIKSNFWLILIFLFLAIYIKERKFKYIMFSIFTLISMLLYFKFLNIVIEDNASAILMNERFSHIFDATSIYELIVNIISMDGKLKKLILIVVFFIPFSFFINFKKVSYSDILISLLLIFPTFSYCFLSNHVAMSYWVQEHYSTPILAIIFIMILKYQYFSKIRVYGYLLSNLILFLLIISLKQPWQYKYYQDETQLLKTIVPTLLLKSTDYVLADDRTGIYFTNTQVDYIEFDKKKTDIVYKNIIINLRYIYSSNNLKHNKPKVLISSYSYLYSKDILKSYNINYINYPFIIYGQNKDINLSISEKLLDTWDNQTKNSNKWIQ
jgi:hypothetical protein